LHNKKKNKHLQYNFQ